MSEIYIDAVLCLPCLKVMCIECFVLISCVGIWIVYKRGFRWQIVTTGKLSSHGGDGPSGTFAPSHLGL